MILYHITRQGNVGSILKKGLIGYEDEAMGDGIKSVNLTSSLEDFFRPIREWEVCLVIDTTKLNTSHLEQLMGWWWRYQGDLPAQAIIRIQQGEVIMEVNHEIHST